MKTYLALCRSAALAALAFAASATPVAAQQFLPTPRNYPGALPTPRPQAAPQHNPFLSNRPVRMYVPPAVPPALPPSTGTYRPSTSPGSGTGNIGFGSEDRSLGRFAGPVGPFIPNERGSRYLNGAAELPSRIVRFMSR